MSVVLLFLLPLILYFMCTILFWFWGDPPMWYMYIILIILLCILYVCSQEVNLCLLICYVLLLRVYCCYLSLCIGFCICTGGVYFCQPHHLLQTDVQSSAVFLKRVDQDISIRGYYRKSPKITTSPNRWSTSSGSVLGPYQNPPCTALAKEWTGCKPYLPVKGPVQSKSRGKKSRHGTKPPWVMSGDVSKIKAPRRSCQKEAGFYLCPQVSKKGL